MSSNKLNLVKVFTFLCAILLLSCISPVLNTTYKIKQGIKQNTSIWPTESKWYYDNNNYAQEVQIIKDFISLRLKQLDNRFNL